jgi:hypothetical protein
MGRDQELIESARSGNFAAVDRILGSAKPRRAGPFASLRRAQGGVGARDGNGYTALHYAALNGHKEVVRLLLSYEASTNRYRERTTVRGWRHNRCKVKAITLLTFLCYRVTGKASGL